MIPSSQYLPLRLEMVLSSGILPMLFERKRAEFPAPARIAMYRYKGNIENLRMQPKSLSMGSNVAAVFLVWTTMCTLSSLAFVGETAEKNISSLCKLMSEHRIKFRRFGVTVLYWQKQIFPLLRPSFSRGKHCCYISKKRLGEYLNKM